MSSTNKTTYYDLPQFVDSDLFNPLADDNDAYSKIDTALHNIAEAEASNANEITGVKSRVTTAEGKIETLETQNGSEALSTTAQTLSGAVNELDSDITSLDNRVGVVEDDINNVNTGLKIKVSALETQNGNETLNTESTTLSGAINEVNDKVDNITTFVEQTTEPKIAELQNKFNSDSYELHAMLTLLSDNLLPTDENYTGICTDGTYLYVIGHQNYSTFYLHKIDIATNTLVSSDPIAITGHSNGCSYHNGYIYCSNTSMHVFVIKLSDMSITDVNFGEDVNSIDVFESNGYTYIVTACRKQTTLQIYIYDADVDYLKCVSSLYVNATNSNIQTSKANKKFIFRLFNKIIDSSIHGNYINVYDYNAHLCLVLNFDNYKTSELEDICFIDAVMYGITYDGKLINLDTSEYFKQVYTELAIDNGLNSMKLVRGFTASAGSIVNGYNVDVLSLNDSCSLRTGFDVLLNDHLTNYSFAGSLLAKCAVNGFIVPCASNNYLTSFHGTFITANSSHVIIGDIGYSTSGNVDRDKKYHYKLEHIALHAINKTSGLMDATVDLYNYSENFDYNTWATSLNNFIATAGSFGVAGIYSYDIIAGSYPNSPIQIPV